MLLLSSNPLAMFMTEGFLKGLGNGDSWDLFWYNNAQAAGNQMYPSGNSKYFDVFSWPGWVHYTFMWLWVWFCTLLSPLTLGIPLNIWFRILEGDMVFTDIWKILIPPSLSWFFHVQGEDGWPLY